MNHISFYKFLVILIFITGFNSQIFTQPIYLSSASNVGKNTIASIIKPAGTVEGNLLIIGLMIEKGSDETISAPSGWTLIQQTNNSTSIGMATYYKIAEFNEPTTYYFGLSNGSKWAIGCARFTNVDPSNPIDISNGTTGNGKDVNAPALLTSQNNSLVICLYTNDKKST